jgi:hypothetical protein
MSSQVQAALSVVSLALHVSSLALPLFQRTVLHSLQWICSHRADNDSKTSAHRHAEAEPDDDDLAWLDERVVPFTLHRGYLLLLSAAFAHALVPVLSMLATEGHLTQEAECLSLFVRAALAEMDSFVAVADPSAAQSRHLASLARALVALACLPVAAVQRSLGALVTAVWMVPARSTQRTLSDASNPSRVAQAKEAVERSELAALSGTALARAFLSRVWLGQALAQGKDGAHLLRDAGADEAQWPSLCALVGVLGQLGLILTASNAAAVMQMVTLAQHMQDVGLPLSLVQLARQ